MDDYPVDLAPHEDEARFFKEPFSVWWRRVQHRFPSVPKNVARQWLHRHWRYSEFAFLPSEGASFELVDWSPDDIEELSIWRAERDEYADWGRHLLQSNRRRDLTRYRVAPIMGRRGTWPAPIIILDHDGRFQHQMPDLPLGPVLIEGNRRSAIALALARAGRLAQVNKVWMLSYRT